MLGSLSRYSAASHRLYVVKLRLFSNTTFAVPKVARAQPPSINIEGAFSVLLLFPSIRLRTASTGLKQQPRVELLRSMQGLLIRSE